MLVYPINIRKNRGAALFVSLMLLLILTVLGLSSSNVSIMQERMAGNVLDNNLAFQDAEETLREIESRLDRGLIGPGTSPTMEDLGLSRYDCTATSGEAWANWGAAPWQTAPETGNNFFVAELGTSSAGTVTGSSCRPMSELKTFDDSDIQFDYYLIVARGAGPGGAEAIVQSIFALSR